MVKNVHFYNADEVINIVFYHMRYTVCFDDELCCITCMVTLTIFTAVCFDDELCCMVTVTIFIEISASCLICKLLGCFSIVLGLMS